MAVKVRLQRLGKKNRAFYRIVVQDSRTRRNGATIDIVGHYDPIQDPEVIEIDVEKLKKWLSQGARLSDSARQIIRRKGILSELAQVQKS